MNEPKILSLFEAFGIELEYMIVDAETLDVKPVADALLARVGRGDEFDVDMGPIAWSNELALHVIELKTNGPSPTLDGVASDFQEHVALVESHLGDLGARLMPSAMHPWMNPDRETRLWPHENNEIYQTFDRIFDCRGHGWSNLQSMHINLPFSNDAEFARLHAAIRLVLPLLPGIAASSPFADGKASGFLDTRLEMYRNNAKRIASVSGQVVPERVFSRSAYENELLGGIYEDLRELDPDGVLRHEWVNARGAIARFERMAIEIRVLDLQECPAHDLAVAKFVVSLVRALAEETWASLETLKSFDEARLSRLFLAGVRDAEAAIIDDAEYLGVFGIDGSESSGQELFHHLVEVLDEQYGLSEWQGALDVLCRQGSLARRLSRAVGTNVTHERLHETYLALSDCLRSGRSFSP
jgi:gamma-glutamyl:cysteine ligase YbdK (ATP-grasp superfamily)